MKRHKRSITIAALAAVCILVMWDVSDAADQDLAGYIDYTRIEAWEEYSAGTHVLDLPEPTLEFASWAERPSYTITGIAEYSYWWDEAVQNYILVPYLGNHSRLRPIVPAFGFGIWLLEPSHVELTVSVNAVSYLPGGHFPTTTERVIFEADKEGVQFYGFHTNAPVVQVIVKNKDGTGSYVAGVVWSYAAMTQIEVRCMRFVQSGIGVVRLHQTSAIDQYAFTYKNVEGVRDRECVSFLPFRPGEPVTASSVSFSN